MYFRNITEFITFVGGTRTENSQKSRHFSNYEKYIMYEFSHNGKKYAIEKRDNKLYFFNSSEYISHSYTTGTWEKLEKYILKNHYEIFKTHLRKSRIDSILSNN